MRRVLSDRPLTGAETTARYRARNKDKIAARVAADKKANPEKYARYKKVGHQRSPGTRLLWLAKGRAKKAGLDFNLTRDDVVVPDHCPVLGIPLFVTNRGFSDNSPTIDRIDNARGYVRGNVIVVSWRANRLKGDATVGELQTVATFYADLAAEKRVEA